MSIIKIQNEDGEWPSFQKSFIGYNSAPDRPISVKLCVRKQFFTDTTHRGVP